MPAEREPRADKLIFALISLLGGLVVAIGSYEFGQIAALHEADAMMGQRISTVEARLAAQQLDHQRFDMKLDQIYLQLLRGSDGSDGRGR